MTCEASYWVEATRTIMFLKKGWHGPLSSILSALAKSSEAGSWAMATQYSIGHVAPPLFPRLGLSLRFPVTGSFPILSLCNQATSGGLAPVVWQAYTKPSLDASSQPLPQPLHPKGEQATGTLMLHLRDQSWGHNNWDGP